MGQPTMDTGSGFTYNGGILAQFSLLKELMDSGLNARSLMPAQCEVLEVKYKSIDPMYEVLAIVELEKVMKHFWID